MAGIEQRPTKTGEPRFRVHWREDGERQQITFATGPEADEFRAKVEAYRNHWPPGTDPRGTRPDTATQTFGAWAKIAIQHRTRASERTKDDYLRTLDRHMAALLPLPVDALTDRDVAAWLADRKAAGLSGKTIRNLHGLASSIMADACAQHPPLATHNPFAKRLGTVAAVRTEEMVFFTPSEFALILSHMPEDRRYRELARLLYGTGLRYGEATALTVRDVELFGQRKTLTVTKAWKRTGPATWEIGEPKTARSRRTVSLSVELVDMLIPLVATAKPTDLLFPGTDHGRLPHTEFYKRGWAPAVARANVCAAHFEPQRDGRNNIPRLPTPCDCPGVLGKTPRIHDCRHSHVAALIAEGIQLPAISRRLGHSSITITFDRYGHLDPSHDLQIDAAVDRALAAR